MLTCKPRHWSGLGAIFLGAALWTACGSGGAPPQKTPSEREEVSPSASDGFNTRLAPDFALQDTEGKTVSLGDLKGKVVFIDFWATWCPPCRISMPEVKKIQETYQGKNVQVVGLSVDEDPEDVLLYVRKNKIAYPVLLAGDSDVSQNYGVGGIPHFVLVDQEGRIVQSWEGYAPGYGREWRLAIDTLL